jgi:transcriptional regulator with XRE-family HTH domain
MRPEPAQPMRIRGISATGRELKQRRETIQMSQAQLADLAEVGPHYVSEVERQARTHFDCEPIARLEAALAAKYAALGMPYTPFSEIPLAELDARNSTEVVNDRPRRLSLLPPQAAKIEQSLYDSLHAYFAIRDRPGSWFGILRAPPSPEQWRAQLTVAIGCYSRLKEDGRFPKYETPVRNDRYCTLESTHLVFQYAVVTYPEIEQGFQRLMQMLRDLRDLRDQFYRKRNRIKRTFRIDRYINDIRGPISYRECYLFLLYFTYLRIESERKGAPTPDEAIALIREFHFFDYLEKYLPGVNDCFVQYNGIDMFCPPGGREFKNRFWYERTIQSRDSLQSIIQQCYYDPVGKQRECIEALKNHNPHLMEFLKYSSRSRRGRQQ